MTLSLIVIIVLIVLIFLAGLNLFIYITEHNIIFPIFIAMIVMLNVLQALLVCLWKSL
jgi:hypothetical protein